MIPGVGGGGNTAGYFLQSDHRHQQHLFRGAVDGMDDDGGGAFMGAAVPAMSDCGTPCHVLINSMSLLRDKVQQLHPLIGLAVAPDGPGPVAAASGVSAVIQDIVSAASSMNFAFQHLCHHGLGTTSSSLNAAAAGTAMNEGASTADSTGAVSNHQAAVVTMDHVMQQWKHQHGGGYHDNNPIHTTTAVVAAPSQQVAPNNTTTIIELDAAELLAMYTHFCQVCGKGFKRDANLRMHMRAHGDEYKTSAALANPACNGGSGSSTNKPYYSCPEEGCRWNRKHAKFQPLKSVICAKNHYKRSHCPKMYVCNNCNSKHFSVLSDLRTHEKHCGVQRWRCSCGTSFSRKDKLVGHLALFAAHGHQPAVPLDGTNIARNAKRAASIGAAARYV